MAQTKKRPPFPLTLAMQSPLPHTRIFKAFRANAPSNSPSRLAGELEEQLEGRLEEAKSGRPSRLGPPLTIAQAAELIGCSPWTVRQTLIPKGLPFFRSRASGKLIFYQDQLVRWIENQQRKGGMKIQ